MIVGVFRSKQSAGMFSRAIQGKRERAYDQAQIAPTVVRTKQAKIRARRAKILQAIREKH